MTDRWKETLAGRAYDARAKAAFWSGNTDTHPHGLSGAMRLIPVEFDQSCCWDTAPSGWKFSEFGSNAGSV